MATQLSATTKTENHVIDVRPGLCRKSTRKTWRSESSDKLGTAAATGP